LYILLDASKCKGCRACELACSFHHSGHKLFGPAMSSTRVSRNNDTAKITMSIDSTCDFCFGEEQALCVKYCAYGARSVI
jgi:Fe-S-cluster-containing hydrogenase component 2